MTISLLPYVATFLEQFYFWRSYFFTLFQSNYFDTALTFSEQLFLQSSCFRSTYFFYFFRAKLLASSHFLRIESSSGQLLFGTATFLAEELLRIKISTAELLFPSRYFCTASTFSEKLHFGKKHFRKAIFRITYFFWRATFLERLLFQKILPSMAAQFSQEPLFTTYFFRRVTISQLCFASIATLPIY